MVFKVAVIYFSRRGRLVTLANIIAEGARKVPGAQVSVYRIKDMVHGDDPSHFDAGILDAPVATPEVVADADAVIFGAPGRQGGMAGEMRLFLDQLGEYQMQMTGARGVGRLKGKVAACFTSVGGTERGFGGHEMILQSFMATFLQHGMVAVGVPPDPVMDTTVFSSPFGTVMAGQYSEKGPIKLTAGEVQLAYSQGEWVANVTKNLHDDDPFTNIASLKVAGTSPKSNGVSPLSGGSPVSPHRSTK